MINYLTECNSANTDDPLLMCHVGDLNHSSRAKGQAQSMHADGKTMFPNDVSYDSLKWPN